MTEMTDRIKGFTVTLEHDVRIDDMEIIVNAIQMIKGVAHVDPSLSTHEDHVTHTRLKLQLKKKLFKFMEDNLT